MPVVPRKGILAIAAVIDVALHAIDRPASAKASAARHRMPPCHLEPVLQALVRAGIRGPHGGYELARDRSRISADDILRAASATEEAGAPAPACSTLINDIVRPALAETERTFSAALDRILIGDMIARAEALNSG